MGTAMLLISAGVTPGGGGVKSRPSAASSLYSYSPLNSFSVSVMESAWMSLLVEKSVDFSTDHPLLAV